MSTFDNLFVTHYELLKTVIKLLTATFDQIKNVQLNFN